MLTTTSNLLRTKKANGRCEGLTCKYCTLCGYRGKRNKSMVPYVSQIKTKNKYFLLNRNGVYVATCLTCYQQYNGQTVNIFSTGWSSHPNSWNQPDIRDDSDQMVVLRHSSVFHDIINNLPIYETFMVTFIKQPSFHSVYT